MEHVAHACRRGGGNQGTPLVGTRTLGDVVSGDKAVRLAEVGTRGGQQGGTAVV